MAIPTGASSSAQVRAGLDHPILDGDAHYLEPVPDFLDFVRERAGEEAVRDFRPFSGNPLARGPAWHKLDWDERRHLRRMRPPWWVATGNTLDWATAVLPKLYYERLDEMGIDFAVLYPTSGLGMVHMAGDARAELCRLFNEFIAGYFGPYSDRMAPAALVPLNTPEEGIAGLEHAVGLGLKVGLIPSYVHRPNPELAERAPEVADAAMWVDTFGIDSPHDYDPFWAKAVELGVPLACHSNGMGFSDRASISNYMYNHMGHFAASGEALAKSLFLGGVTRRFPKLRVALLEGGVTTGVRLYCDLIARWHKRGGPVVGWLDPAGLDTRELEALFEKYGGKTDPERVAALSRMFGVFGHEPRDELAACGIERVEDIRDLFVPNFYWGCEADDPLVAWAFDARRNPLGARLNAIMGSDVGHWDVRDFTEPIAEAWELVDDGVLDAEEFRAFVFDNPLRFYGGPNPDFFRDTVLESYADDAQQT